MPASQVNLQDESHLKLLSVFHYVLGALSLLGIIFLVAHFMMMRFVIVMADSQMKAEAAAAAIVEANTEETALQPATDSVAPPFVPTETLTVSPATAAPASPHSPAQPFPKEFMVFFIIFYVVGAIFLIGIGTANILSGRFIARRKHRTFSYVVAGLNCIQFPFGTTLGIFTFVVLSRISVKMEYQANLPA